MLEGSLQNPGIIDGNKEPPRKVPAVGVKPKSDVVSDFSSNDHSARYDYSKYTDAIGQIYGSNLNDEALPDAASEKELVGSYFSFIEWFAVPVHTGVPRFGRYGPVTIDFDRYRVCSLYRPVQGGLHTGKPSDRYVPPVPGSTGRYGKP
ncbi:hypothetical protein BHM03_00005441 [Ensete ventricosum]|nr:hypothetical protein BHM03_00005441 [Ensete ventricosum]